MKNSDFSMSSRVSKFFVGLMVTTAMSTGYTFSQNTSPADSLNTKPKTEKTGPLFWFKKNVLSVFEKDHGNSSAENKTSVKSQTGNVEHVSAGSNSMNDAISATRLKERHSKEHLSRVAAQDLLTNELNTTIDDKLAKYTYGDLLERNGSNMKEAVSALVKMTEDSYDIYKSVTADFHTLNARVQKDFVAKTVRPDVKKGEQSQYLKLLNTQTQLSQIMPEGEILSALNTPKHIGNMKNRTTVDNDTVASMERLVGFSSVDLGAGDARKLFNLVVQGKGNDKLSAHFPQYKAIVTNIIKPYDHENKIDIENVDVKTLANMETVKYIMKNAGAEQEKKLFVTKAVIQTIEEKKEAAKTVAPQVKTAPQDTVIGNIAFEKTAFYYGSGQEMLFENAGDEEGYMPNEYGSGTYAAKVTKIGIKHNFTDFRKAFENNAGVPKTQFGATAEIGFGSVNYKGVANPLGPQSGFWNVDKFNQSVIFASIGGNVIRGVNDFGVKLSGFINLKPVDKNTAAIFPKGLSPFLTFSDDVRIMNGITKKGTQYYLGAGVSYTIPLSGDNTRYGHNYSAINNAAQKGEYNIPFKSTFGVKVGGGFIVPNSFKPLGMGGTEINLAVTYGGSPAKVGNGKNMFGFQMTISPKSIPFFKKHSHSDAKRIEFTEYGHDAVKKQAKSGKNNYVIYPGRNGWRR